MTDRKKPGVAFCATVVMAVVVAGYPLSFGPAYWLWHRPECPVWAKNAVDFTYQPIWSTWKRCPVWADTVMHRYWHWWTDD